MSRGVRWCLAGSLGFGRAGRMRPRHFAVAAEREPWRREAEVACLSSGTVKEGAGLVNIVADRRSGHVRRGLPAEGVGARRRLGAGLCRRTIRPPGSIPGGTRRRSAALADPAAAAIRAPTRAMRRAATARRADVDRSARHRRRSAARISSSTCSVAPPSDFCRRRPTGGAATSVSL